METNDILRRRQTPYSSGYRQGLLNNDYLSYNADRRIDSWQYRKTAQAPVVINSLYEPPDSFQTNPPNHTWNTSSQPQAGTDSLLYLSTPKPISFRRTVQTQTPSRTLNSNNYVPVHHQTLNPAHDYGSNSLFSYGCCCMQCVRTTEVGIVENFGRFEALLEPGFHCIPWPLVDISGRLSLVRFFCNLLETNN